MEDTSMTWYVLRHAHKARGDYFNPQLRHQDQPLSVEGQQAAERLVPYFADKSISAIYVSAYQRTLQTAAAVAEHLQVVPVVDERLNEIDNGYWDDMTEQEVQQVHPEAWRAYVARTADFRFPGGETGTEAQNRINAFFDEKMCQHIGSSILVVSHEGLIRTLMCSLMGLPAYRRGDFHVDYCGLTELAYQTEYRRWKLLRFNARCP